MPSTEELTGRQFKSVVTGGFVYKFIRGDLNHRGFSYKVGRNEDIVPFDPSSSGGGGLHFTTLQNVFKFESFGNSVATIELLDESRIVLVDKKTFSFKANVFNVLSIASVEDFINQSDENAKAAVKQNGRLLYHVKEKTEEICKLAIKNTKEAVDNVHDHDVRRSILRDDGMLLKFMCGGQTPLLCKTAVRNNGLALRFVRTQTDEICKLAVANNGNALRYVRTKTPEICEIAVARDPRAFRHSIQTDELALFVVGESGKLLRFVKNQTPEICIAAVKQNPWAVRFVHDQN